METWQEKECVLYLNEHVCCENYALNEKSLIYFFDFLQGHNFEYNVNEHVIVFVKSGKVDVSWGVSFCGKVSVGGFFLVPSGNTVKMSMIEDSELMVCRPMREFKFCETFHLDSQDVDDKLGDGGIVLYANYAIRQFVKDLKFCIDLGVCCWRYMEMKISELMYLFRFFYTKEELSAFFNPVLSSQLAFRRLVYTYWQQVDSVEELAEKANCHRDTFTRKFQKVMGTTPRQWMKEKKAESILQKLKYTQMPLKEIAEEFDFSSPSAFNAFCRKEFNETPARIRNNKKGI